MVFKYKRNKSKVIKKCSIEGCNNNIDGKHKSYCNKHYKQIYIYGHIKERTIFDKNEIIINEDNAEIILYDKYNNIIAKAIIDKEDVDKCRKFKWGLNNKGYAINSANKLFLHKFILNVNNLPKDLVCDHINRNRLDNRKSNLRIINRSENCFNRNNVKGYTYINSINKYIASIKINGTSIYLGHYNTELGAKLARERAENKYFKNIKYNEKANS